MIIVMFPIALPNMFQVDQTIVRLDALWLSHTRNHDFSSMQLMGNTGAFTNWVSLTLLNPKNTPSLGSLGLRITMSSVDMETGAMLGSTISITTGINHG
jgi:hypothetical protein